jgi:hypothetical protein
MIDEAERELWTAPEPLPASASVSEMRVTLLRLAATIIARQLEEQANGAITERNTLLHQLAQAGREALERSADVNDHVGKLVQARHHALDAENKELLKARYRDRQSSVDIAAARGWDAMRVDQDLFVARSSMDWRIAPGAPMVPNGQAPSLIEGYLAGTIDAASRVALGERLMNDLPLAAHFESQVRVDLVLSELLLDGSEAQARTFVASLSGATDVRPSPPTPHTIPSLAASSAAPGGAIRSAPGVSSPVAALGAPATSAPTGSASAVTFGTTLTAPPGRNQVPTPPVIPAAAGDGRSHQPQTKRHTRDKLGASGRRKAPKSPTILITSGVIAVVLMAGLIYALRPTGTAKHARTTTTASPVAPATAPAVATMRPPPAAAAPVSAPSVPVPRHPDAPLVVTDPTAAPVLNATPADATQAVARDQMVWSGGDPARAGGWSDPKMPLTANPALDATVQYHGKSVIRLHIDGARTAVFGWNWLGWYPETEAADITAMKSVLLAIRVDGTSTPTSLRIGLEGTARKPSNEYDLMQHYAGLTDGQWHEVAVPIEALVAGSAFDPHHTWELRVIAESTGAMVADVLVADVGFAH